MNTPIYDKGITALLVVDPYNDFISEGGKIWPRIKAVAEANNCVPHMLEVLSAARKAKLRWCAAGDHGSTTHGRPQFIDVIPNVLVTCPVPIPRLRFYYSQSNICPRV